MAIGQETEGETKETERAREEGDKARREEERQRGGDREGVRQRDGET